MVDWFSAYTRITPPEGMQKGEKIVRFGKLDFVACNDNSNDPFPVKRYERKFKNLKFTITGNVLVVQNSLHKFYHGNNFSDFTFSELKKSIIEVEHLTEVNSKDWKITSMELGCNINLNTPALQLLNSVSNFRKKYAFDRMKSKNNLYGLICELIDFSVKLYAKCMQDRLTKKEIIETHLLRVEIIFNRQRKIGIISTLSDLLDQGKFITLAKDYLKILDDITFCGESDLTSFTSREREFFYAGQSPKFWQEEKKYCNDGGHDKRKRFDKLILQIPEPEIKREFIEQCSSKTYYLINS